jgi:hypothetical protein
MHLSPESLSLRRIGGLGTFVATLPMSGVKSHEFFVLAAATGMMLPGLMIFWRLSARSRSLWYQTRDSDVRAWPSFCTRASSPRRSHAARGGDIKFRWLQPREPTSHLAMRLHPAPRPGLSPSDVCCQIAAKKDQLPLVIMSKGSLTRAFVVAGGGFEPPTSGL